MNDERPLESGGALPESIRRDLVENAELPVQGLVQANEAQARLAVGISRDGQVVLEFGRAIRFVKLPVQQALQISKAIHAQAVKASGMILPYLGLPPEDPK